MCSFEQLNQQGLTWVVLSGVVEWFNEKLIEYSSLRSNTSQVIIIKTNLIRPEEVALLILSEVEQK